MADADEPKRKLEQAETVELSLQHLRQALENLSFGSITLTVHEHRVVQIDITEKLRF